ncbi:MAG: family 78 glycoside hydrolase catalytic domain [Clostridia bacterium]|nr:family 78 glycoside hydrolase catalytic domain [Clostridia bacterium]
MQSNYSMNKKGNNQQNCPLYAKWITYPKACENTLKFKKEFSSEGVISATLEICGLGFFNVYVNGKQVDERYFMPAFTDYAKRDLYKNKDFLIGKKQRVFVHVYDVTDFLRGKDELSVTVGNGYYHNEDRPEEPFVSYGDKKLFFVLRLSYRDREDVVVSDETVLVKRLPAVSGLYNGEYVDFSAKEEDYVNAVCSQATVGELVKIDAKDAIADAVGKILYPKSVKKIANGVLYDFGINHSGGIVCKVKGEKGRKLVIKYAEVLYENGEPNFETGRWCAYDDKGALIRLVDQSGTYVLSGGKDEIKPSFSWACYRYAFIEDADGIEISDVKSYFIYTDVENSNSFVCDNEIFNEIHEKTRRTILCNMHAGILSDCPHREKRPYTGDIGIVSEMLLYDLNAEPFLNKWLGDILNSQTDDGFIPYTVPYMGGGGGYAWSNVIATLPIILYRTTGKVEYVEKSYLALTKWIDYCKRRSVDNILRTSTGQTWCLGDWLAPEITEFNIPFMSTLCYHQAVSSALYIANVLDNGDQEKWAKLKNDIAQALNDEFFDREKVTYCRGIQGENVLPLAYGIVPKEYEEKLKEKVRYTYVVKNGGHIDTGIVATPIVLEYLTENGMADVAFSIMTKTDYPSFAYMLDGETTLSEHWSKKWPDYHIGNSDVIVKGGGHLSHCHPMFGSVVAWLYKRVAGIDLSNVNQGVVKFTPRFTKFLKSASANVETSFGKVSIKWNVDKTFCAEICVPSGLSGVFELETDRVLTIETAEKGSFTIAPNDGVVKVLISNGNYRIKA